MVQDLKKLYEDYSQIVFSIKIVKKENDNIYLCGSGTCFLVGKYLITNYHVLEPILDRLKEDKYLIHLYDKKSIVNAKCYPISTEKIERGLTDYRSDANNNDYIILDLDIGVYLNENLEFFEQEINGKSEITWKPISGKENKYIEFDIGNSSDVYIGQRVVFFGYTFDKINLSMHTGIISSVYERNCIKVFQIDGSVNNGNSGGPLIDVETGKIIGIISRKENGLNQLFDDLKASIKSSLNILNQPTNGFVTINGINPLEAQKVCFANLNDLVTQIERSTNVGIGYAFSMDKIKQDIEYLKKQKILK